MRQLQVLALEAWKNVGGDFALYELVAMLNVVVQHIFKQNLALIHTSFIAVTYHRSQPIPTTLTHGSLLSLPKFHKLITLKRCPTLRVLQSEYLPLSSRIKKKTCVFIWDFIFF